MEAFKAFATLTLVDMISNPLAAVGRGIGDVSRAVSGLGDRFGKFALAMAPVAIASGVVLGAFMLCASQAIAFESSMADVAKVVNFTSETELKGMSDAIKDLSGRIPMAASGLAAIVAAAGQSGVAKNDLLEFTEQAAKMGVAFDLTGDQSGKMMADWRAGMSLTLPETYALADATNHLSNNMNATAPALGEVLQRVGAVAMSCGLAETEVAALGAAFLSAGASPEVAATALKKFTSTLAKGAAMTDTQATAFTSLGFSASEMAKTMQTDAQGTIFKVLEALADKPKELQMSLLTQMFGEEAIGAIAPLLGNMGNLSQAFDLVGDSSLYAGSMQAEFEARSATTENALQLMQNKLQNLAISVGTIFLPVVKKGAEVLGSLADSLRSVVDSPFGQWLLPVVASMATGVLALTGFSAGIWALSKLVPMLVMGLAPLKAAILGVSWPILLIIGLVAILYTAYTTNFGGMADTIKGWFNTISLVFRGVTTIFQNLTGSSSKLGEELAQTLKAAGLMELVVNISKVGYRIQAIFKGIMESMDFSGVLKILAPIGKKIAAVVTLIGNCFAELFGGEISSGTEIFTTIGNVIGTVVIFAFEALATVLTVLVNGLSAVIYTFSWLGSLLMGDFAGATEYAVMAWDTLCDSFMAFADLFRIGDWMREAWADASNFLSSINLFESGAKILDTLKQGILSQMTAVKDSVTNVFSNIRNLLPFSDAKEGPLSQLTLNGARIMTTLAEGVTGGASELYNTISGTLQNASKNIIPPDFATETTNTLAPQMARQGGDGQGGRTNGTNTTIHIGQLVLPNATDGKSFLQSLEDIVTEYGGGFAR